MAVRKVLTYPDPQLKIPAEPIDFQKDPVEKILQDLKDTLYAHPGIGLAANQIGYLKQAVFLDLTRNRKPLPHQGIRFLINPKIVWHEGTQWNREGCLSVPEYTADIQRHDKIHVEYLDEHGKKQLFKTEKFESVAVQHEMDHLLGYLFLDRLLSPSTQLFQRVKK